MRRWTLLIALPLMVAFGFGVYFGYSRKHSVLQREINSGGTGR